MCAIARMIADYTAGAATAVDKRKKLLSYINAGLLASVPWMQVSCLCQVRAVGLRHSTVPRTRAAPACARRALHLQPSADQSAQLSPEPGDAALSPSGSHQMQPPHTAPHCPSIGNCRSAKPPARRWRSVLVPCWQRPWRRWASTCSSCLSTPWLGSVGNWSMV